MVFPQSIDATLPTKRDTKDDPKRALESAVFRDTIIALQEKLGIDGSTDVNSIDYKINNLEGGGTEVKSGQATSPKQIEAQVDFASAFLSTPAVTISAMGDKGAWLTEVTTTYFKWNNNSKNTDVTIHWIAV